jgi:chromosome partitioning protein
MGSVISVVNIKGGVGKTTIAHNLSHALTLVDKRKTLLVDLDFQENLTERSCNDIPDKGYTIIDLLNDRDIYPIDCKYKTKIPNVDIIPGDMDLSPLRKQLDPGIRPNIVFRLAEKLDTVRDSYDFILIDTHPDLDVLTTMALMASDYYMIPLKPEGGSIEGLEWTDEYLRDIKEMRDDLQELGIILTDVDHRTTIGKEFRSTIEHKCPGRLLDAEVGRNTAITNAEAKRETIYQYNHRAPGAKFFKTLACEIIQKVYGKTVREEDTQ